MVDMSSFQKLLRVAGRALSVIHGRQNADPPKRRHVRIWGSVCSCALPVRAHRCTVYLYYRNSIIGPMTDQMTTGAATRGVVLIFLSPLLYFGRWSKMVKNDTFWVPLSALFFPKYYFLSFGHAIRLRRAPGMLFLDAQDAIWVGTLCLVKSSRPQPVSQEFDPHLGHISPHMVRTRGPRYQKGSVTQRGFGRPKIGSMSRNKKKLIPRVVLEPSR